MADPKAPATVEEYIAQYPPERREVLEKMREVVRRAAPNATEKMSWGMPTYHQKENLVHFAMQKHHVGFYPSAEGVAHFLPKLAEYKTTKGGIQLPLAKPIPYALVEEITRWRVAQVEKG